MLLLFITVRKKSYSLFLSDPKNAFPVIVPDAGSERSGQADQRNAYHLSKDESFAPGVGDIVLYDKVFNKIILGLLWKIGMINCLLRKGATKMFLV